MRKWLSVLCAGLMCSMAVAQPPILTKEAVKLQLADWNTFVMCTLPEIWNAADRQEALNQFGRSDNPEEKWIFSTYVRSHNAIMENYFGGEDNFEELLIGGALLNKYEGITQSLSHTERNAVLVKDCDDDWETMLREKRNKLGYKN